MYDLIRVKTEDGLLLNGLYSEGDKNKPAIIHIHGFEGDFYTNEFLVRIAQKLQENKLAFVLAQNRGTGIQSWFIKNKKDDSLG